MLYIQNSLHHFFILFQSSLKRLQNHLKAMSEKLGVEKVEAKGLTN